MDLINNLIAELEQAKAQAEAQAEELKNSNILNRREQLNGSIFAFEYAIMILKKNKYSGNPYINQEDYEKRLKRVNDVIYGRPVLGEWVNMDAENPGLDNPKARYWARRFTRDYNAHIGQGDKKLVCSKHARCHKKDKKED
jgi:hypothetical protein